METISSQYSHLYSLFASSIRWNMWGAFVSTEVTHLGFLHLMTFTTFSGNLRIIFFTTSPFSMIFTVALWSIKPSTAMSISITFSIYYIFSAMLFTGCIHNKSDCIYFCINTKVFNNLCPLTGRNMIYNNSLLYGIY